ncbi:MAG TPA: ATP-binding protein [Methylibium sp.]|uniref:sensor histidine kinase n=1 Tax=Methylibium sp. TaxID=2067992 RepID=UPI002DB91705|nr:ATP-binding protein [Methylibium sp.]HEU4459070.1 ATP-binding protein [Methylibium sp.]
MAIPTSHDRRRPLGPTAPEHADSRLLDQWLPSRLRTSRWLGWRLRALILAALFGCLGLFALTRMLAAAPQIDATWRTGAHGELELAATGVPALGPFVGQHLRSVRADGDEVGIDATLLLRSPRWLPQDADRFWHRELQQRLGRAWSRTAVTLDFGDGGQVVVVPAPQGPLALGLMYWLLGLFALALYLVAMLVVLVRPSLRNALYAVMSLAQVGNLLFIAVGTSAQLGLPPGYAAWEPNARMALDLLTAAAIVHATSIHPRRLPGHWGFAAGAWLVAALLCSLLLQDRLPQAWWWTQVVGAALGALAVGLLGWSYRIERHPYAMVMRRFGLVSTGTWLLLTIAIAVAQHRAGMLQIVGTVGSTIWVVFLASLLLLLPFISKSQQMLREFSLLAGISTFATALDLLFISAFSLGQLTSATLAVFVALGLYSAVRQWMLNHLRGTGVVSMERLFERLYRMAREVEARPDKAGLSLLGLLREWFEPIEATVMPIPASAARVSGDGSTLTVPVPQLGRGPLPEQSAVLRFSQRGQRLFTEEDARLADRIVDQLKRAVVFDQAVERGRSEERSRIAQDLHDDIGARLLTLMYQARSPEQEDYIRHTLQDLKTLTRGLAVHTHRLSHAAAEWKTDLQQRLELANVALEWRCEFDQDVELSVVQWSALTRVLRELVSNVLAHAQARHVEVLLRLAADRLELVVADDGRGHNPQAWAHGLGLGGIRKRVKQLGGEVHWSERQPTGIACRVAIADWSQVGS